MSRTCWLLLGGLALLPWALSAASALGEDATPPAVQPGTTIQSISGLPALVRSGGQPVRPIAVDVLHVGAAVDVTVQVADRPPLAVKLQPGRQVLNVYAPRSDRQREVPVQISAGGRLLADAFISLGPVRKWEVHLVHQTHLDIGYTHTQEEVLRLQVDHLRKALEYIEQSKDYPYDMVLLRYNIGADNGPPNPVLPEVVKAWNEKYVCPRLIIARNSDVLQEFARRYGNKIPVIRGDFTPYWEDGAASTSLATSVNRRACDNIAQAQILWAMLNPALDLHERFDAAWTKMIMYDEHTWGAHNSVSQPDHSFAIRQDEYKQAFAFDGSRMTDTLLADVTRQVRQAGSNVVDVFNTASWNRSGLILIGKDESAVGDLVKDAQNRPVPSQRLASGELALVAWDVPAFGSSRYTIHPGNPHRAGSAKATDLKLTNGLVSLEIDPKTGAINSLRHTAIADGLVDTRKAPGLNNYLYIIGRDAGKNRSTVKGPAQVTVDAPMLQFDPIQLTGATGTHGWRTSIDPGAFIHSWVMNNHWETNYKADQEGLITFRYVLRPHAGGYDGVAAQHFGRDICQPLVVVPSDPDQPAARPLLRVDGEGVVVTSVRPSRDGKATMIRLFAASGKPERFTLHWSVPSAIYVSSPDESRGDPVQGSIDLPGFGIATLRVERASE